MGTVLLAIVLLALQAFQEKAARSLLASGNAEAALVIVRHPRAGDLESVKLYAEICLELNKAALAAPHLQANSAKDTDGSLHQLLGKAYQRMHRPTPAGLAFRRAAELRKAAVR
jgi:hypothetical protein